MDKKIAGNNNKNTIAKNGENITQGTYDHMLKTQENSCAICKQPFTSTPHIDHNHTTGKVRNLLCSRCNTSLGLLSEDINILSSMIHYINKWN